MILLWRIIAIYDEKNKNIFVGDAIVGVIDNNPNEPPFMPPDFNEQELLKTYQKFWCFNRK